jgi:hypothetical protein
VGEGDFLSDGGFSEVFERPRVDLSMDRSLSPSVDLDRPIRLAFSDPSVDCDLRLSASLSPRVCRSDDRSAREDFTVDNSERANLSVDRSERDDFSLLRADFSDDRLSEPRSSFAISDILTPFPPVFEASGKLFSDGGDGGFPVVSLFLLRRDEDFLSFVDTFFLEDDDACSGKSPELILRRSDNAVGELFVFCMNTSSMVISESAISPSILAKRDGEDFSNLRGSKGSFRGSPDRGTCNSSSETPERETWKTSESLKFDTSQASSRLPFFLLVWFLFFAFPFRLFVSSPPTGFEDRFFRGDVESVGGSLLLSGVMSILDIGIALDRVVLGPSALNSASEKSSLSPPQVESLSPFPHTESSSSEFELKRPVESASASASASLNASSFITFMATV